MYFSQNSRASLGKRARLLASTTAAVALVAIAGMAQADAADAVNPSEQTADAPAPAARAWDDLSYYGVTLYATVDLGVSHDTHGAGFNKDFAPGENYIVQKSSNKPGTYFSDNGLSQSTIGVKGTEEFAPGYSAIFKFDTGFNPASMRLASGATSVRDNNGLAAASQTANGDSSRSGQIFNGQAYVGVQSAKFGTLTYGRNNTLLLDDINAYDPQGGSYAFSVIGFSGVTAGAGDTEDARLDSSVKYNYTYGPGRLGLLYQNGGQQWQIGAPPEDGGSAEQIDLGGDYANLSVDALFSHKKDAVNVGSTSAVSSLLSATVSDNTSWALMGKYTLGDVKLFAGYERDLFANPSRPLSPGSVGLNGFALGGSSGTSNTLNNTAFNENKVLQVFWTGAKYAVTDKLNVAGAYYAYRQNNYSGAVCSAYKGIASVSSSCNGALNAVSFSVVYNVMKHLDVYGGAMYTQTLGGLASGYPRSNNVDPTAGVRITF
jgi:predicted porin